MTENKENESEDLSQILQNVAKRLEDISENLKNNPDKAQQLNKNQTAIKEILLGAFAASGKEDVDDSFIENLFERLFPKAEQARLLGKKTKITIEKEEKDKE